MQDRNVDSSMEEHNPTMKQLGLRESQHKNGDDEERTNSHKARVEAKPIQEPVTKPTPKTKEQVEVEDVTCETELDAYS